MRAASGGMDAARLFRSARGGLPAVQSRHTLLLRAEDYGSLNGLTNIPDRREGRVPRWEAPL